ncbi:MAG: DUF1444 family protein [Roseiflexaceae bacterium]|nr:DUF1444 family protein [Roseiflexaceae bacterium]
MTNGTHPEEIMDAERFALYIERRLALSDEIELIHREGLQLRVGVRGQNVEVDLANYYQAYRDNPAQLDAVAQTFARVLLGQLPERTDGDYNLLAERIYPMLKPATLLATVRERNLPMLAYRDFLAGLIIAYVIDEQNSVAYINENHLESWDVTMQDLHEQALDNLRRRTDLVDAVSAGEDDQRLFMFSSGDGYDATRLLLSDVLQAWARNVSGNLVIGIPNRDFLIAFGDDDQDVVQNIAMQVESDSLQREHGLTARLFTLTDGQVREYDWE